MPNRNLKVLAIDPSSTNTGWCVWDGRDAVIWSSGYGDIEYHSERLATFEEDVSTAIAQHRPTTVAFEIPPVTSNHTVVMLLMGMAGMVQLAAERAGLSVLPVNLRTIKAHGGANKFTQFLKSKQTSSQKTANRKASKEAMIQAATYMGFTVENDDEADAAILADYVLRSAVVGEAGRAA